MALRDTKQKLKRMQQERSEYIVQLRTEHTDWTLEHIADVVRADPRFGECNKMDVSRALKKAGIKR